VTHRFIMAASFDAYRYPRSDRETDLPVIIVTLIFNSFIMIYLIASDQSDPSVIRAKFDLISSFITF